MQVPVLPKLLNRYLSDCITVGVAVGGEWAKGFVVGTCVFVG